MDENKTKKIILYICYIPWILLGFLCVYWGIIGYNAISETYYGLHSSIEHLLEINNYLYVIFLISFIYIVWYYVNNQNDSKIKNKKHYKTILYISFIPLIILIISFIYYLIVNRTYGFVRLFSWYFEEFFDEYILNTNFIGLIFIICFVYQLWYFFNMYKINPKLNKNINHNSDLKKDTVTSTTKNDIRKLLFIISCVIWNLYFLSGIYAMFNGYTMCFFTCSEKIYGIKALKESLFMNLIKYSLIPILPITLIYIIIYLFKRKK